MKTRARVLFGLVVAGLALGLTGAAIGVVLRALESPAPSAELRQPREWVLAMPMGALEAETLSFVTACQGRIVTGRSLDVRSAVAGPLVWPAEALTQQQGLAERDVGRIADLEAAALAYAAATLDGHILLIGEGDPLKEAQATILCHQGDLLMVADVALGRDFVLARALQLGPCLRVEPVRPAPAAATAARHDPARRRPRAGGATRHMAR